MSKIDLNKRYVFRDKSKDGTFEKFAEFYASGLVTDFSSDSDPDNPKFSLKDMGVAYFNPFSIEIESLWRGFNEVDLFEISETEWTYLNRKYSKLEIYIDEN